MTTTLSGTSLWTEPESAANTEFPPIYPYNDIKQTKSGHTFEMDDTPDRERIRIQHRANTFIEMHPNGDEVHKIYGNGYEVVIQDKNVLISGNCNITINGNANIEIYGDKNEKIHGDYNLEVSGTLSQRAKGIKGVQIQGDQYVSVSTNRDIGGTMSLSAGDHILINSDLEVYGGLTAQIITSKTRVDAATGVKAGELGFYTTGPITSPLAHIGIMNAIQMSDVINSVRYNFHVHPAPHGVTGTPSMSFLPPI
jgi:hypothetical protein